MACIIVAHTKQRNTKTEEKNTIEIICMLLKQRDLPYCASKTKGYVNIGYNMLLHVVSLHFYMILRVYLIDDFIDIVVQIRFIWYLSLQSILSTGLAFYLINV